MKKKKEKKFVKFLNALCFMKKECNDKIMGTSYLPTQEEFENSCFVVVV